MYYSRARVIPVERQSFIGEKGVSLTYEASERLSRLPLLEALVICGKAKFVRSDVLDGSCEAKAAATGLPLNQILSIAFFDYQSKEDGSVKKFGVVRLACDKLDAKSLVATGLSGNQAKRAKKSEELPIGMRGGTCSPIMSDDASKQVDGIVIASKIDTETIVDMSIGGIDNDAHEYSVQLKFGEVLSIMRNQGLNIYHA